MDNIEQAKQVLRSQAMMGMRETMKKVAREVFEEEVRPLLEKMVLEAVNATLNMAVKPYEITVETAPPVEPDPDLVSYGPEQPPEKKRRRWWR